MATQASANGSVKAYPAGAAPTSASSLQYAASRTTANGVVVKVGTDGKVSLYVSSGTHLVADVQGWFPTGSELVGLNPARVLDTRDGTGAPDAALPANGSLALRGVSTGRACRSTRSVRPSRPPRARTIEFTSGTIR